jgi:hypothetical protein
MLRMGRRWTRHPQLGTAELNVRLAGRRELTGSRRGAVGRSAPKRVDPSRVARGCGIRPADAVRVESDVASGLCPASVRWWSESRGATLAANSKPSVRWNTTKNKVAEMMLALLSLTMFEEDQDGARTWKGTIVSQWNGCTRRATSLIPGARPNRSW